ncbi:hypothetical protein H6G54_24175 [Anabaena cylindrica FACHB-243]|uniref:Uncharacterized protein n=1 Tax=Anabaena cylindrica (strain ATCC 27899 / PCC 7122) TaxID=272123 RepID=K9ZI34_ANACC|nr:MULTISPECIES: hypothetical protein [Anabaena]AFZ58010.1 hypothetical protein Anacy_2568 [Anabaena cylindrica PCC 7122]MBD2420744.1 hypothetical protein [Anabaena cylindrica FACHB-243]MBY5282740.1 hypothetical protein [Anabaena sp. CCAP 1446/1C]MBY5311157.1 hypothetical protein [Anabaena sp. CCAP 1446/1C]MCM2408239.1 hypothetical protein [Anabaena sp. CCAP 1446/1C]
MSGYLIYHPRRAVAKFDATTVYHDHTSGNQDPYVWNKQFLHTYCHITQMSPAVGDVNFWVSGDTFPNFSHLYCDLVFVVAEKLYWKNANTIDYNDTIVDSDEAYIDHYRWVEEHHFKRRRRYTLKANPERSFQPQDIEQKLIDILPFVINQGLTIDEVRQGLRSGFNSKPLRLDSPMLLYDCLKKYATVKLDGIQLQNLRKNNPHLASL